MKTRFGQEIRMGGEYCRAKRYSFVKVNFNSWDSLHCSIWARSNRNWKKYRKFQHKSNKCDEVGNINENNIDNV